MKRSSDAKKRQHSDDGTNPPALPKSLNTGLQASRGKVILPADLPATLKQLGDDDLETLMRGAAAEKKRRGLATPEVKPGTRATDVITTSAVAKKDQTSPEATAGIPPGKANLIRASFREGLRPSTIARMFRVSEALVKRLVAQGKSQS